MSKSPLVRPPDGATPVPSRPTELPTFKVGDLALVDHARLPSWPRNCLQDPYFGPYRIISIDGSRINIWLAAFVMVELRCSIVFVGMVVSGRRAPRYRHPVGRRSRFDPCTPGWFGVGRLACGLFTAMWRLQLRCGRCAVVAAASWWAGFLWARHAAAGRLIVKSCLCSQHIRVGAGYLCLGLSKCSVA